MRLQRRHGEFDGALIATAARDHETALTNGYFCLRRQTLAHRVTERATVGLVDERNDVGNRFAERIDRGDANNLLGRLIQVVDATGDVCRDDAFTERVERFPSRRARSLDRGCNRRTRSHLDHREQ